MNGKREGQKLRWALRRLVVEQNLKEMKLLIFLGAIALFTSATCQNGADQTIKKESTMPSTELKKEGPALAQNPANQQVAVFGGGCFWCVEAIYQDLKGVSKVRSGYAGGSGANPSYREVCSGLSGHAEVIEITGKSYRLKERTGKAGE